MINRGAKQWGATRIESQLLSSSSSSTTTKQPLYNKQQHNIKSAIGLKSPQMVVARWQSRAKRGIRAKNAHTAGEQLLQPH
jgi:hypothetical protein